MLVEHIAELGVMENDEELQKAVKYSQCYRDKPFSQFRKFLHWEKKRKIERADSSSLSQPRDDAYLPGSLPSPHSP